MTGRGSSSFFVSAGIALALAIPVALGVPGTAEAKPGYEVFPGGTERSLLLGGGCASTSDAGTC